jgi:NAD(P)-dependent dehydrogenase (short-subunit alcohol dehydrogenase family)
MFKDGLLASQHILITGGGTGLGRSMGRRFLEMGARLTICGRRLDVLEATAAEHRAATGGEVTVLACDVRDSAAVDRMVVAAESVSPVTALVNNAAGNFLARSEELSPRAIDAVVGIVLKGSLNLTLALGRRWLADGRRGTVLSIVTSYAWTGSAHVLPSAVAKAGVLAMTRSLAVEWGGRGVRLNAIAPGPFPTEGRGSGWCRGRSWPLRSRPATRSAARASIASSPISPPICSPTAAPISTARWSRSTAASG